MGFSLGSPLRLDCVLFLYFQRLGQGLHEVGVESHDISTFIVRNARIAILHVSTLKKKKMLKLDLAFVVELLN